MVTIRFARGGAKKRPFYQIVVTEHSSPRDGDFIERLGYYNPTSKSKDYKLDVERTKVWLDQGAQVSGSVKGLLRKEGLTTA
ncbi:30S ribosomal protein S16 [Thiohalorhabdus methylotrophus]|uniref:Small ribosomal subunit protein bS16 n=1 Tax=Thiohalorhabdus methylotrophus TaxID=3242694 RepID=A0ABV4U0A9_9GAMM